MGENTVSGEYKEHMVLMVLTLILGIVILILSIAFLHEGLIAISIPLLIIPSIYLVSLKTNSMKLLQRYVLYGLFLSAILELLFFIIFTTITGKAFSMSIGLGILFYLLYRETYIWLHERRRAKITIEYATHEDMERKNDNVKASC